jgi:hypothetical protein
LRHLIGKAGNAFLLEHEHDLRHKRRKEGEDHDDDDKRHYLFFALHEKRKHIDLARSQSFD